MKCYIIVIIILIIIVFINNNNHHHHFGHLGGLTLSFTSIKRNKL